MKLKNVQRILSIKQLNMDYNFTQMPELKVYIPKEVESFKIFAMDKV